jgi:hypothetical protein
MNGKTKGTPKTLQEAIKNALQVGTVEDISERVSHHVRDFLAQKFGVSILKAHTPEQEALICELWAAITGEDCSKVGGKKK